MGCKRFHEDSHLPYKFHAHIRVKCQPYYQLTCTMYFGTMYFMKGTTEILRGLEMGEQVYVKGRDRGNIYRFARNVGIKVKVEQVADGFNVTRIAPDALQNRVVAGGGNGPMPSPEVPEKQVEVKYEDYDWGA